MKVALLGLPSSGKRTLFRLLTGREIPAGRRADEAVQGRACLRDARVDVLSDLCRPEKTRYAETEFVLCPDMASGTERNWLEEARRSDALCMVIRGFRDPSVYHPSGSVSADRDRKELEGELFLSDLMLIERRLERIAKEQRATAKGQRSDLEQDVLKECSAALEEDRPLREIELSPEKLEAVRSLGFLTLKPWIWTYNVDEEDVPGPEAEANDAFRIACRIEEEIAEIDDPVERREFLESIGLEASGVDRMNSKAYDLLGLMSFYTIGKDEVRAWTIRKGSTAPEAAGKIHSDLQRGFIRAEIIRYDELVAAGGEAEIRRLGKVAKMGRDYIIQDGDICSFLFNV